MRNRKFKVRRLEPQYLGAEELYNKYAYFYNNYKCKITALSQLINIRSGIIKQWNDFEKSISKKRDNIYSVFDNIEDDYKSNKYEVVLDLKTIKRETVEKLKKRQEYSELNYVSAVIDHCRSSINSLIRLTMYGIGYPIPGEGEKYIHSVEHNMNHLQEILKGFKFRGKFKLLLNDTLHESIKMQNSQKHIPVLNQIIVQITNEGYPDKVKPFIELPDSEKGKIKGRKVGRPLNEELPQSDVEEFVKSRLYPNGELTESKRFIHSKGKYKGAPNWNQLTEKYLEENPNIELQEIISKRRLTVRIKKAYDVIKTSMK